MTPNLHLFYIQNLVLMIPSGNYYNCLQRPDIASVLLVAWNLRPSDDRHRHLRTTALHSRNVSVGRSPWQLTPRI